MIECNQSTITIEMQTVASEDGDDPASSKLANIDAFKNDPPGMNMKA
jgi:hypothetical protein